MPGATARTRKFEARLKPILLSGTTVRSLRPLPAAGRRRRRLRTSAPGGHPGAPGRRDGGARRSRRRHAAERAAARTPGELRGPILAVRAHEALGQSCEPTRAFVRFRCPALDSTCLLTLNCSRPQSRTQWVSECGQPGGPQGAPASRAVGSMRSRRCWSATLGNVTASARRVGGSSDWAWWVVGLSQLSPQMDLALVKLQGLRESEGGLAQDADDGHLAARTSVDSDPSQCTRPARTVPSPCHPFTFHLPYSPCPSPTDSAPSDFR